MTNYSSGHDAEKRVADYLRTRGFRIHDLNWKTKYCEIDIVAERAKILYLIEVKSRKNALQGQGVDYITKGKLKRMQFAAEYWVSVHSWQDAYQVAVVAVDGESITLYEEVWV